jgi:hypothetical protein
LRDPPARVEDDGLRTAEVKLIATPRAGWVFRPVEMLVDDVQHFRAQLLEIAERRWVDNRQAFSKLELAQAVPDPGGKVVVVLRVVEPGAQQTAPEVVIKRIAAKSGPRE